MRHSRKLTTHARTHARTHGITARIFGCALSRMIRRLQEHYALQASFFRLEKVVSNFY